MSHSRKTLHIGGGIVSLLAVSWFVRQSMNPAAVLEQDPAPQAIRQPGGEFRESRLLAAETEERVAASTASGLDPDTDTLENARLVSRMPVTAGHSGIWSGVMPSDAAIGGRVAYAFASVGDSRADLRPDQFGTFQRAYVPKETDVEINVRYPGLDAGETVSIGVFDGGSLEGASALKADNKGSVNFVFRTGSNNGSYRLMLSAGNDVKILDFWAGPHEEELRHLSNSAR